MVITIFLPVSRFRILGIKHPYMIFKDQFALFVTYHNRVICDQTNLAPEKIVESLPRALLFVEIRFDRKFLQNMCAWSVMITENNFFISISKFQSIFSENMTCLTLRYVTCVTLWIFRSQFSILKIVKQVIKPPYISVDNAT